MAALHLLFKKVRGEVWQVLGRASKPQQISARLVWEGSFKEDASCCRVVWRLKE